MQILQGQRVDFLVCEYEWDFVDRSHVLRGNNCLFFHIAEQSDLALDLFGKETISSA